MRQGMRREHGTGVIAGAWREWYRRGWPVVSASSHGPGIPGGPRRVVPGIAPGATTGDAPGATTGAGLGAGDREGAGGNHSCTEIPAVPTRAPGTEHASQTSHLVRMTQPGGDRPPPAPS